MKQLVSFLAAVELRSSTSNLTFMEVLSSLKL